MATTSNKKRVLVIQPLHPAGMEMLRARDDIEIIECDSLDENVIAEAAKDVHAMTVRGATITRRIMSQAPDLMVVSRHGVGYPTRAVDLDGKNLLIIGFGRIGKQVAKRALGFDLKVFGYDPYVDDKIIKAAHVQPVHDFKEVLGEMDAVAIHCMKTQETTNMFSEAEFKNMKRDAFVVNCARGGIIDEDALYNALTSGEIKGAGLDVLLDEPSSADHPLFSLKNVLLSPHIAGVTVESTRRMATQTVDNVLKVFDGNVDPECVVNQNVLNF